MKRNPFHQRLSGFTLIELMISVTVLTLLTVFAGRIYLNYLNSSRDLKAGNLVYEEARFLMERIVREVRQNAIDYEQYYNRNVMTPLNAALGGETGTYSDNYCSYSEYFYDNGADGLLLTLKDNENRGTKNPERSQQILDNLTDPPLDPDSFPAAIHTIERELYLINIAGTKRTMLTRVQKTVNGLDMGKVALLRLIGLDYGRDYINSRDSYNSVGGKLTDTNCKADEGENDGLIDTWFCDTDFPCKHDEIIDSSTISGCEGYKDLVVNDPTNPNHSFIDISPNAINVVDLKFLIAPQDDPWKAYGVNSVQIQPHVTIQLTVEANPGLAGVTGNRLPSITLTSTVTSRSYDEIKSDCL